jgi:signal transduction histidine kinase
MQLAVTRDGLSEQESKRTSPVPGFKTAPAPLESAALDASPNSERLVAMAVLAAGGIRDLAAPTQSLVSNLELLDREITRHDEELIPGRVSELRQRLQEAVANATRIRDAVRDMAALGREDGGTSEVDLQRVLLTCIKVARTEIDHRARVITEFDVVPPVVGSESRLYRLFLNLIMNAAQAVAGDPQNEHFIRVVTRNEPDRRVSVDVIDSGPGILPEHLGRVFEPFFTTKPVDQGTGLGLALCRRIVEDLDGDIFVESTPGKGAMFRVTLPMAAPAPRLARDSEVRFVPSRPPVRRLPRRAK